VVVKNQKKAKKHISTTANMTGADPKFFERLLIKQSLLEMLKILYSLP